MKKSSVALIAVFALAAALLPMLRKPSSAGVYEIGNLGAGGVRILLF